MFNSVRSQAILVPAKVYIDCPCHHKKIKVCISTSVQSTIRKAFYTQEKIEDKHRKYH